LWASPTHLHGVGDYLLLLGLQHRLSHNNVTGLWHVINSIPACARRRIPDNRRRRLLSGHVARVPSQSPSSARRLRHIPGASIALYGIVICRKTPEFKRRILYWLACGELINVTHLRSRPCFLSRPVFLSFQLLIMQSLHGLFIPNRPLMMVMRGHKLRYFRMRRCDAHRCVRRIRTMLLGIVM
jgi:hypothetical protein